jgi:hypothetical protein
MPSKKPEKSLAPAVRARLARKGRLLYGKSCGLTRGRTCAESFALYHIRKGSSVVACDLLGFLDAEVMKLKADDPDGRLAPTLELAARIRRHLNTESGRSLDSVG